MDQRIIGTNAGHSERMAQYAVDTAQIRGQRTGQRIFHSLPAPVAAKVRGTSWDPFNRTWGFDDIVAWFNDHIVFNDKGDIIALYAGNELLWEEDNG
jgi:hypothetical protein